MLRHFLEDFSQCDFRGNGGNLTELQKLYHQQWLRIAPFQLQRNRRLHASVIGFRSTTGQRPAELLRPGRPIARLHDVQLLMYVPIPQEYIVFKGGRPRRQNYREHFEIQSAFCENGDVWFSNRNALHFKVAHADGSLQPRQDHLACVNKHCGHVAGSGLGDQIEEARAEHVVDNDVLIAPISGKISIEQDELWYHIVINGKSVFRVLNAFKDAFAFDENGQENPVLLECLKKGRVAKGDAVTKLSRSVEYLAAVIEDGSTKTVYISGDRAPASRYQDRLEFMVEAKRRIVDYSEAVEFGRTFPDAAGIPFADRFPRLLLEISPEIVHSRRIRGWKPNDEFRNLMIKSAALGDDFTGLLPPKDYTSYEALTADAGADNIAHLEDVFFDKMVVCAGQRGWIGEGVCVDSRIAGEELKGHTMARWLDFSEMSGYYVGQQAHGSDDYESGLFLCPAMPLDLSNGMTRRVKDVNYDFQPAGPQFAELPRKFTKHTAQSLRGDGPRTKRRRKRNNRRPEVANPQDS